MAAGDEAVIGVDANGISPEAVSARVVAFPEVTAAENLQQIALTYWMEHDVLDTFTARTLGVQRVRLPSLGVFAFPLTTEDFFGIPVAGHYGTVTMDVQRELAATVATDNRNVLAYRLQSGIGGSYLEGSVLDQLRAGGIAGWSFSTAQLLIEANQSGVPIQVLTPENQATTLPLLGKLSAGVRSSIQQALNAGLWVFIPRDRQRHFDWHGSGYVVLDPRTAAGAYLIEGGLNGGAIELCEQTASPRQLLANFLAIHHIIEFFGDRLKLETTTARSTKTLALLPLAFITQTQISRALIFSQLSLAGSLPVVAAAGIAFQELVRSYMIAITLEEEGVIRGQNQSKIDATTMALVAACQCDEPNRILYHYTDAPASSFSVGLYSGTYATFWNICHRCWNLYRKRGSGLSRGASMAR